MSIELKDLTELLDATSQYRPGRGVPEPPTEDEVARCIQTMLSRQCIYRHQTNLRRTYFILRNAQYREFFEKYFAAMGLELNFDHKSEMISLRFPAQERKRFDWQSAQLKKDETLVLLALKLAYEEGFKAQTMTTEGAVDITTDDLVDRLTELASVAIEETRMNAILDMLRRKGVVQPGDRDPVERIRPLSILPGIDVACLDSYIQQLTEWAGRKNTASETDTTNDTVETDLQEDANGSL